MSADVAAGVNNDLNPTTEDFAALLEQSFGTHSLQEGTVVKGTVVAIEKDLAVIERVFRPRF